MRYVLALKIQEAAAQEWWIDSLPRPTLGNGADAGRAHAQPCRDVGEEPRHGEPAVASSLAGARMDHLRTAIVPRSPFSHPSTMPGQPHATNAEDVVSAMTVVGHRNASVAECD